MKNFAAALFMLMLVAGGLTACGVDNDRNTIDRDVERNVQIDRDKDGIMDKVDVDRDRNGDRD